MSAESFGAFVVVHRLAKQHREIVSGELTAQEATAQPWFHTCSPEKRCKGCAYSQVKPPPPPQNSKLATKPGKIGSKSEVRILFCPLSLLREGQNDHLPSLRGIHFFCLSTS